MLVLVSWVYGFNVLGFRISLDTDGPLLTWDGGHLSPRMPPWRGGKDQGEVIGIFCDPNKKIS